MRDGALANKIVKTSFASPHYKTKYKEELRLQEGHNDKLKDLKEIAKYSSVLTGPGSMIE